MAGTSKGGVKSAAKLGTDFYKKIGAKGGKISRGGGFTDKQKAREAGKKGGAASALKRWGHKPTIDA
jgi:general stress protein YciG